MLSSLQAIQGIFLPPSGSPNRQSSSGAPCLLQRQRLGTMELNILLQALAAAVRSVSPLQAVV